MKYVEEGGRVWTLIPEKHSFMEIKNHFTDSLLYRNSLEADPQPKEADSGDKEYIEPESED